MNIITNNNNIENLYDKINSDINAQTFLLGYWLSNVKAVEKEIWNIMFQAALTRNKVKALDDLHMVINNILYHLESMIPFNDTNAETKNYLIDQYKRFAKSTNKNL